READGNPAFSVASYGKGKVFFLTVPLEMLLTQTPGVFHISKAMPCWQVYRYMATAAMQGRAVRKQNPLVALTEHSLSPKSRVLVALNQSPDLLEESLALQEDWMLDQVYSGEVRAEAGSLRCALRPNAAAVFSVRKGNG
ncbi:MAG TPA: hypothetical protein VHR86_03335, partial [Armatimonadota bacterium]|nr:hypothetical protein [Armatimonadota bacterium]